MNDLLSQKLTSQGDSRLEETACPLCGALQHNKKNFQFPPFKVVQCNDCLLWYLSPRLKEEVMLASYCQSSYFVGDEDFGYSEQYKNNSYSAQKKSLKQTFRYFLKELQQLKLTGGRLLEIGSAYGYFLEEAYGLFDSLTGTDFDTNAVKKINSKGFKGVLGGVDSISEGDKYDLIISNNVIEHVYQPKQFVTQLKKRLTKNGWIVLATPYANNMWFKTLGRNWPSFKIPEHITFYDKQTLGRLLYECGAELKIPIKCATFYPVETILSKLGVRLPVDLSRYTLRVPDTMFAMAAKF